MPDLDLYQGAYTGPQIDSSLAKVVGADTTPIAGSSNLITSGGVKSALTGYAAKTACSPSANDINGVETAFKAAANFTFITVRGTASQGVCVFGMKFNNTIPFAGFFNSRNGNTVYAGLATRTPDANGDGTWTFEALNR